MTVVVVHGNFLGPWSWDDVASGLSARGIRTIVVDLPSGDPAAQLGAPVRRRPRGSRGDVVGGRALRSLRTFLRRRGHHRGRRWRRGRHPLVYLAGAAPDAGDSLSYLHVSVDDAEQAGAQQDADGEHEAVRFRDDGMIELTWDSAAAALFHDCDAARVEQALEQLRPKQPDCRLSTDHDSGLARHSSDPRPLHPGSCARLLAAD
jgi:hypothetical protein